MVYDVTKGDFDTELCEAAGLDPAMLPQVRPSTDVVGTLRPDVAADLGLPATCAVVVGTGDEHAASVGAGAIEPGVIVDVTGTAEPVTTVADEPVRDPLGLVETHGHAVPGTWLIENPGFVSGGSTLWLSNGLLGIPQADVFARAREAPPASDGVLFLPALSGSTAPRWNDSMRGAFLGLAMNHTSAHVARAVLEGCAYALRDIVDRLDALHLGHGEVRIVGGGARDDLWASIKADVLGRPVRRVLSEEATAVGAAMVAGVGSGVFASFAEASVAVQLDSSTIDPDPGRAAALRRGVRPLPCRLRCRRVSAGHMISIPEPNAILATLRERGHADLPDVDIRIGASVLDDAIKDSLQRFGKPVILSDGGPYRTPAGPVVDRLAEQLGDCPVIQLGTGTVRADEETVERAVAEVGYDRLVVSVGAGTLTDIAKVTAQRTGSRHVAVQTACSINGFIADRSVLVIAGAKRTVVSRWPDHAHRRLRHPDRGTRRTEPRRGGRPLHGPERGRRVAARGGSRPWTRLRCRSRRAGPCRHAGPSVARPGRARRRAGRSRRPGPAAGGKRSVDGNRRLDGARIGHRARGVTPPGDGAHPTARTCRAARHASDRGDPARAAGLAARRSHDQVDAVARPRARGVDKS